MTDVTTQLMNSELPALSTMNGIERVDGDIYCHVQHQGKYTDVGSKEEADLLRELQRQPWRDIVRQRFAERQNWLYRIITEPSRTRMLDELELPEGGHFLDVGSGWGQLTVPLARRGDVYALDQTVSRLKILREIARQEGVEPHYLCGDIRTLPLRPGFFDLIVFNGSFEYTNIGCTGTDFDSHLQVLRRVRRALAPDGRVYIGIENAVGLKYILGAPDDHTNKKGFTYRLDRENGTAARTWPLDQYLRLFKQAGLVVETAYACFPDYKLISRMVPLEELNEFLLIHGLPCAEHSGVNGAALGLDTELRSLYENFARMGIAQHFAPSFGFVLVSQEAGVVPAEDIEHRSRDVAISLLRGAGHLEKAPEEKIQLHRVAGNSSPQVENRTARFEVRLGDLPIASLKCIPRSPLIDPEAILAVYREYQAARTFRPVRLIESQQDDRQLWLLEEFVADAVSLDDLTANGDMSADEATDRIVRVVDDVFEISSPVDQETLDRELAECESSFKSLFDQPTLASALFSAFRDMILSQRDRLRSVLSTRDYIGRNLVRTAGGEWVLLDYDLACRTALFCLDVARNFIQMPLCTNRLLTAKVFSGLDGAIVRAAAVAMEYSLQRRVHPTHRLEAIRSQFRLHFLREWAPAEIDDFEAHRRHFDQEMRSARAYQENLEAQLEAAREFKRRVEENAALMKSTGVYNQWPKVDILVVSYNSARWLDGFVESLRRLRYPPESLRLVFVDNGSKDDSVEKIKSQMAASKIRLDYVATGKNLGFTGGYETAFRYAEGDYYFVVNLDTAIEPDAVNKLVEALEKDPKIGIAEARQSPREHPKYYDAVTGETSWCSGACMLIRPSALRQIGGGFERSFFMYCEDVDLSWRMWLHGWKCVYVPDAVVEHFTEDLDPKKTPKTQHYYTMRNSALMRAMYGSKSELFLHYAAMLRLALMSRNPWWHKRLTFKAIFASLMKFPMALRGRELRGALGPHPWVFFNGWLFGRHARDLVCSNETHACHADLISLFPVAKKTLSQNLPIEQHITINPAVTIVGHTLPAILAYSSAKLDYQVTIPRDAVLTGAIAAPPDTWANGAVGRFTVRRNGEQLWQHDLNLEKLDERRWVPFEIPLEPTGDGRMATLTIEFEGVTNLAWGLWGRVRVDRAEVISRDGDPVDALTGLAATIVIPTHNRADSVPLVVQRLMTQDVPPERFEVIVVDSASSDRTTEVLASLAKKYPTLTALRSEKPGAAAARNMGLDGAKGPLVVLLDDDILVGPDFVRRILRAHHERPDRVLLGRIVAPWDDSTDPFERYLLQVQDVNIYDFPDNSNVPANYFYTACVAIPRDVLGATRFDEGFSVYGVEDIEFGFRLLSGDRRMVFLPNLGVVHDYYPTFESFRRKKYKAGYSLGYFHERHPDQAQKLTFGRRFVQLYPLLRAARVLSAPLARLAYYWERIRYRTGPVNRLLYRWWYLDLRIRLYEGLLRFKRGEPPP